MTKVNRGSHTVEDWQDLLKEPGAEMVGGKLSIDHKEVGKLKDGVFLVTHAENLPGAQAVVVDEAGMAFVVQAVDMGAPDPGKAGEPQDMGASMVVETKTVTGVDGQAELQAEGMVMVVDPEADPLDPPEHLPPEPPPVAPTKDPVNVDVPHLYQEGDQLICTMGNWEDPPPDSYAWQYRKSGLDVGTGSDVYTVQALDIGSSFDCEVTAFNSLPGQTMVVSNSITVADPADLPARSASETRPKHRSGEHHGRRSKHTR